MGCGKSCLEINILKINLIYVQVQTRVVSLLVRSYESEGPVPHFL